MILLKFVKIRISFQVKSQLTERREKLMRNCMQQNVVDWRVVLISEPCKSCEAGCESCEAGCESCEPGCESCESGCESCES